MNADGPSDRRRVFWLAVALLLLTVIVYWPALRGGFIWDDADHLTENQAVVAPNGLHLIWSSLSVSRYYPLTLTTFWIQRRLWGLAPVAYHATNLIVHAINTILLFLLLRRLRVRGAWMAAALWGVHPVNVESVAWITELKNMQSGLFFLLCLLCYLRFEVRRELVWYIAALVLFVAALLSKPSTVFLPAALLLSVWWERGRWQRDDVLRICPFLVAALLMSLVTILEQQRLVQSAGTTEWSLGMAERFVIAGRVPWFYAGKLLWPINASFAYPRWTIDIANGLAWLPLVGALVIGTACWRLRRLRWVRACVFGLGYFIIALLPVLGFLNIYYFRYSFVADHFNYLASMGFIALVVAGFATLIHHLPIKVVLSVVALAVLGGLARQRTQVFHDDETLWRDTLRKNPTAVLALNNLGNIDRQAGRLSDAASHFRRALVLEPDYPQTHNNLGVTLAQLGRRAEAEHEFQIALNLWPRYLDAHQNLVRLLAEDGRDNDAIAQVRILIELQPHNPSYYLQLGELLQRGGHYAQTIEAYQSGLRESPTNPDLARELARLRAQKPAD